MLLKARGEFRRVQVSQMGSLGERRLSRLMDSRSQQSNAKATRTFWPLSQPLTKPSEHQRKFARSTVTPPSWRRSSWPPVCRPAACHSASRRDRPVCGASVPAAWTFLRSTHRKRGPDANTYPHLCPAVISSVFGPLQPSGPPNCESCLPMSRHAASWASGPSLDSMAMTGAAAERRNAM